jgi:hypothetical protein
MCDKLVFDLAQEIEGSPSVFVRKDWLNILDNQNQNYNNNQSILDTSQLSNSNKWMNYREAYLLMPLVLTIGKTGGAYGVLGTSSAPTAPAWDADTCIDYAYGLKNWFGSMIHSFTLDYNGTTIIQQTPLSNMWNSFKLMTSLSYGDLITQGDVIGFHPDDSTTWEWNYQTAPGTYAIGYRNGTGVCNNSTYGGYGQTGDLQTLFYRMSFNSAEGNTGYIKRIQNINFDLDGVPGLDGSTSNTAYNTLPPDINTVTPQAYGNLFSGAFTYETNQQSVMNQIWKSYIFNKTGIIQQTTIMATVYLKHLHSFFNMVPLLKGVFMKMTMNLNNASTVIACASYTNATPTTAPIAMSCRSVSVPSGGINPIMVSGSVSYVAAGSAFSGSYNLFPIQGSLAPTSSGFLEYTLNVSVGATCLNSSLNSVTGIKIADLSKSVYLYIPAYTFNPPFESSYLSSPVKVIKYTDIYQYQVLNVTSGGQFNNLVTNGIANIKSILILPFYSTSGTASTALYASKALPDWWGGTVISSNTGFTNGIPVYQSPFDPAGTGPTSPLCMFSNFNVQISGQNAIYNVEKYSFEQFNNQLYGQNSVNGGLTDGLTSGLIGRKEFDMEYCYYYINVERMLPVEETVPKSVQILGTNQSGKALDLFIFVEYGLSISIDALTGARV